MLFSQCRFKLTEILATDFRLSTTSQVDEGLSPVAAILTYAISDFLPQQLAYIKVEYPTHFEGGVEGHLEGSNAHLNRWAEHTHTPS